MTKHLLQTTIAGSLPKPSWLAEPLKLWSPWKLEGEALTEGQRDAVRLVLRDQEQAGIDILSDGEQTRQHFVTTFIEHLDGVDFQRREVIRIRDRYDADGAGGGRAGSAAALGLCGTCPLSAGRNHTRHKVHPARPHDHGRHPLRRPLPQPRKTGLGVRQNPQRRSPRA